MTASAAISVLIPTSPSPLHPDTAITQACVDSARTELPDAEILLLIDGIPPEQEPMRQPYEDYQERLLNLCRHWEGVLPVRFDTHHHQAAMTLHALEMVRTPLIAFVEHDWVFQPMDDDSNEPAGAIPWIEMATVLVKDRADVIRLSWETSIVPHHRNLYDPEPITLDGARLLATRQWSQRPHLARTDYYRRILAPMGSCRTMIEDFQHGTVSHAWRERGQRAWNSHRLYLFFPEGNISRVTHLDGRRGAPAVEGFYAYPDVQPAGAPAPTVT